MTLVRLRFYAQTLAVPQGLSEPSQGGLNDLSNLDQLTIGKHIAIGKRFFRGRRDWPQAS